MTQTSRNLKCYEILFYWIVIFERWIEYIWLNTQSMLSKTERQFAVIYAFIVLFEIISGSITSLQSLHYIAKPAILISLVFFFYKAGKDLSQPLKNLMFLALICSLLGDILLMFVAESAHFFTCAPDSITFFLGRAGGD